MKKTVTTPPSRNVDIYVRHSNGETFRSMAEEYGLSVERVRQIYTEQRSKVYREDLNKIRNGAPFVYRVYVCSPLRADSPEGVERNRRNALVYEERVRIAVSNMMREAYPGINVEVRAFAPHGHISTLLDDRFEGERKIALRAGLDMVNICDAIAVAGDVISSGMEGEIIHAVLTRRMPVFLLDDGAANGDPCKNDALFSKIAEAVRWPSALMAYDLSGWEADMTDMTLGGDGLYRHQEIVARKVFRKNAEPASYRTSTEGCCEVISRLLNIMMQSRKMQKRGMFA